MDVDSTICEVHGHHKQGAAYGYTRPAWLPPAAGQPGRHRRGAARPACARARPTPPAGAERFVDELAGRVRRAGASGAADPAGRLGVLVGQGHRAPAARHRVRFSITVRQTKPVQAAIAAIPEEAWIDIDYPDGGVAQVAETDLLAAQPADRAPHPPDRRPGHAVARLALPRLRHRPGRQRRGAGRRPPPPRRLRARHPRPQGRAPGCATAPRAASAPTPPGCWSPPWPTTCCAGSPPSGWASPD